MMFDDTLCSSEEKDKLIEQLETIITFLPANVFLKDKNDIILWVNQNCCDVLSLPKEKIIGKQGKDLMPIEITEKIVEIDRKIMESGIETTTYEEGLNANNKPAIYLTRKIPLKENGKFNKLLGISIDITPQLEAETLQKAKEIAEEKARLSYILAGSIAHEIRTPLAIIKMNIHALEQDLKTLFAGYKLAQQHNLIENKLPANKLIAFENLVHSVIDSTHAASKMIEILLMNIKETPEQFSSEFQTCSVTADIEKALHEYPYDRQEKQLVHFTPEFDFQYIGDPLLTKHILFNLLKNAFYYIKAAGKGEIFISFEQTANKNHMVFKDTAKGIPVSKIDKVFDRYYTQREGGTGLGLSFCKMVLNAYRGDIYCESEENHFAKFILKFPKQN